jgi:hypothetical protein
VIIAASNCIAILVNRYNNRLFRNRPMAYILEGEEYRLLLQLRLMGFKTCVSVYRSF